jgi:hypothetical protein
MMSQVLSERSARWAGGAGLTALLVLAWVVLVPSGLFWNAVAAAAFVGATIATVALVRYRARPSLAQVIATAETEGVAVREHGGRP